MWRDTWFEIVKLRAQRKNYIVVAGHALLMGLVILGLKLSRFQGPMARAIRNAGFDLREYIDGLFFARTLLVPTLLMLFPIFICTLAGDMLAGEVQDGSLKLYAARPRKRTGIVLSKFLAMSLCSFVYCLYFLVAGLAVGVLVFGWPGTQIIPLRGAGIATDFNVMSAGMTMQRYVYCLLYYSVSFIALGSVTLFFSSIFNRMTSATIAGITVYFVSYIIQSLPWLDEIKPFLLSRTMNGSVVLWMTDIPVARLANDLAVLGIYTVVFTTAAVVIFNAKDVQ